MISKSFIKVKSSWGHDINNLMLTHSPKSNSVAILFPGGDGSCDAPLLHYARKATLLSGCDVLSLEYGYYRATNTFKPEFLNQTISEVNEAIQICLANGYDNIYFISKSLGTSVAGEISRLIGNNKINNMFLTPTSHTTPYIVNSKCVVVTGTNDKLFPKEQIDIIKTCSLVDLHIIENATHSLESDDDYIKSLEILGAVTNLCSKFVSKSTERLSE
ncbi:MAG: alpha/beta hydrolase [Clostridiaceae bacterium]|nr:alpha/beta hydrolase [Clostridiaceae bacterium]